LEAATSHFPKTSSQPRLLVVALVRLATWCQRPEAILLTRKSTARVHKQGRLVSWPDIGPLSPQGPYRTDRPPLTRFVGIRTWPRDHSMAEEPEPMLDRIVVPTIRNTLVPWGRRSHRFPRQANPVQGVAECHCHLRLLDTRNDWIPGRRVERKVVYRHYSSRPTNRPTSSSSLLRCGCLEPRRTYRTCQQDGSTRKYHRGCLLFARLRDTTGTLDFT
jgi:hypothetical protein